MYSKFKQFNKDIHVYTFNPEEFILTLTGKYVRTPLSRMNHPWWEKQGKVCYAKINAGYFLWDNIARTVGVDYRDEGFTFSDTTKDDEFYEIVWYGNKLHLLDATLPEIKKKFPLAEWALSGGYPLIEGGVVSDKKSGKFTHEFFRHNRTMIGQKKDGTVLLVVTGTLNRKEQTEVMLGLGAYDAINLDGGGSSEMIVGDKIKNSIGSERPLATSLLVYGDPKPLQKNYPNVIGDVQVARNFKLDELACRHCGDVKFVAYELLEVAQSIRDHFKKAIRLVGYRCPTHNKAIGGATNSGHIHGTALDISAWNNDISPENLKSYVVKNFGVDYVEGLGIYSGHIHIDKCHGGKRVYWYSR